MKQLLLDNEFLLLFVVAGLGYVAGRIRVAGFSLGVAAVLFVGLGIGALDENMKLPEFVYLFGLILFVYTVGLAGGPGFFAALRRRGLRDNLFVFGMLVLATGTTVAAHFVTGLRNTFTAGMYSGALTNTPALAAVLEYQTKNASPADLDRAVSEPVVGYSLAYPVGVLGVIFAIFVMQRLLRADYRKEAHLMEGLGVVAEEIIDVTVRINRPDLGEPTISALQAAHHWDVVFGRHLRDDRLTLAGPDIVLRTGDLLSVIGSAAEVEKVTSFLGERTERQLFMDRRALDFRRIFVSSREVAGKRIDQLHLPQRFGALVTRVRRGDIDLLARPDTVLEPGDRVRVVAPRARLQELADYFGDSIKSVSEIDVAVFSLGIALGILVGLIPIPLPGGGTFKLGLAGGPLLVGLVAGALGRTGPIVWRLPYSANLTLRQLGLILFLAGVGTRSGYAFVNTFQEGGGWTIFLSACVVTLTTSFLTLLIGHKVLHIPMGVLIGMLAGLQTQPAALAFAEEQTHDELPGLGYTTVFPVAMVSKIIFAQLLIVLLS